MKKAKAVLIALVLSSLACGMNIKIDYPPGNPDSQPVMEVATGKPTSASSYWYFSETDNYPSDGVVDGKTQELNNCKIGSSQGRSYWLLTDGRMGWVQVDLLRDYQIVRIRWLNTHNGPCQDRATTRFHIAVSKTGEFAGEEEQVYSGKMEIETSPQFKEVTLPRPISARYVRFYVDEFYDYGGGLNELEVYARGPEE
jgi:hypothetical protein